MANEEILERIQQQLDEFGKKIDPRFERLDLRFDDMTTEVRHWHVQIEALGSKIDQVFDGVISVQQQLDRFRKETGQNFEDLRERVTGLEKTHR